MENGKIHLGGIPILGQDNDPHKAMMMNIGVALTPAFVEKLHAWQEKTGLIMPELVNLVMRMGLMALSFQIDIDAQRVTDKDVYAYIPKSDTPQGD